MELTKQDGYVFQTQPGTDVTPYFAHACAATLAVFGLPAALIMGLLVVMDPDPSIAVTTLLSLGLSGGASFLGATLWMRQSASLEISFGDLMLWGWVRRKRAESQLDRGIALLGLDRRGQPVQKIRITQERQLKVLHDLNDALEAKDPYTRGHSERVERHVYRTAASMGLSVHDLQELRMAAALHDIGKIRVPDVIIRKPGKLTDDERALMEEHSAVGAWMLSHVASADVISAVKHHHERWDGKGYPDGLAGTDIPLYSRIIAVADTFDAITSTRPYRARSEQRHAIEVLEAERGTQFDPMAVDAFLAALPTKVPITAMLFLLPGAGKIIRQIAVSLKRAGAASLAGATTAVSASVAISAATIVPAIDRIPVRPPAPVVAISADGTTAADATAGDTADLPAVGAGQEQRGAGAQPRPVRPASGRNTLTAGFGGGSEGLDHPTGDVVSDPLATLPPAPEEDLLTSTVTDVTDALTDDASKGADHADKGKGHNKDEDGNSSTPGSGKSKDDRGKGNQKKDDGDEATDEDGSVVDLPGPVDPDPGNGNGNGNGGGNGPTEPGNSDKGKDKKEATDSSADPTG